MRNSGVIGDAADCGVIPTLIPAQSRTASRLLYKSPDGNPKQAGLGVYPRIPGLPFGVRRVLPLAFGRVHPDARIRRDRRDRARHRCSLPRRLAWFLADPRDPATVPHDPEPRNCQRPPCQPEPTIPPRKHAAGARAVTAASEARVVVPSLAGSQAKGGSENRGNASILPRSRQMALPQESISAHDAASS